ncbi:MAG: glucosaminidase domain-containing protein [Campylobacteraceae bacterium]|jgi:Bax protein|nr:glucosaminidase domain-containing protein [Campylobacteraceae bacterium]
MNFAIKLLLLCVFCFIPLGAETFTDDFFKIKNGMSQKKEFVKRMLPLIQKANENIFLERKIIDDFFEAFQNGGDLNSIDNKTIEAVQFLAKKYNIDSIQDAKAFKAKVAPVPISLALTQAAVETGWGKSRFFKEAKNAFGQWTYSVTNGLVPAKREEGKTHKIRVFNSVQESVNSYMLNLNRNNAYADFRNLRFLLGSEFDGLTASSKMINYSQTREQYVKLLRNVMINDGLTEYDSL